MTEDKKECCSHKGCCGGKKGLCVIVSVLLILAIGYWLGSMKAFCPMSGQNYSSSSQQTVQPTEIKK